MIRLFLLGFVTLCPAALHPAVRAQSAATASSAALRQTLSLDEGWRFHLGDIARASFAGGEGDNLYGPDITYHGAKAGSAWGAAARGTGARSS
jgi:beta-galactosidase